MPSSPSEARQCPTRIDGEHPLIAHLIRPGVCKQRQLANYHKCPACEHFVANALLRADRGRRARELVQPRPNETVVAPEPPAPVPGGSALQPLTAGSDAG